MPRFQTCFRAFFRQNFAHWGRSIRYLGNEFWHCNGERCVSCVSCSWNTSTLWTKYDFWPLDACLALTFMPSRVLFPPAVVQEEYDTLVYNISRTFSSAGIAHVVVDNDYTLRFWETQLNSRGVMRLLNFKWGPADKYSFLVGCSQRCQGHGSWPFQREKLPADARSASKPETDSNFRDLPNFLCETVCSHSCRQPILW